MVLQQSASAAHKTAKRFRKLLGKLGAKTNDAANPLATLTEQAPPPGMPAEQWRTFVDDYQANMSEVEARTQAYLQEAAQELERTATNKDAQTSEREAESRKERWEVTLDSLIGVGCVYRLTLGVVEAAVNPAKAAGLVLTLASAGKMCFTIANRLAGVAWGLNKSRSAWDEEVNKAATDRIADWVVGKGKKLWEEKRVQKVADQNFVDRLDYLTALQHERDEVHENLERLERRRDELRAILQVAEELCQEVSASVEDARGSLIKLRAAIDTYGEPTPGASDELREEVKRLNSYVAMVRKIRSQEIDPVRADIDSRGAKAIERVTSALGEIDALIAHYDRETWTSEEFQKRLEGAGRGAADGAGQTAANAAANLLSATPIVASTIVDCGSFLVQSAAVVLTIDLTRLANVAKAGLHLIEDGFSFRRLLDNYAGTVGSAGISAEGDLANFFDHVDRQGASDHALQLWDFLGGFEKEFRRSQESVQPKRRAKAVEILHAYQETLVEKGAKERAVFERTASNTRRYIVAHNDALAHCERHRRQIEQAFEAKIQELAATEKDEKIADYDRQIQLGQFHLTQLEQLEPGGDADKKLIAATSKQLRRHVEKLERERRIWNDLPATLARMRKVRQQMTHDVKTLLRKLRTDHVHKKVARIPGLLDRVNKKRAESRAWIQHFQIALAPPGGPPCEIPPLGDRLDSLPLPEFPELVSPST